MNSVSFIFVVTEILELLSDQELSNKELSNEKLSEREVTNKELFLAKNLILFAFQDFFNI
jgi:hypothetical protein